MMDFNVLDYFISLTWQSKATSIDVGDHVKPEIRIWSSYHRKLKEVL